MSYSAYLKPRQETISEEGIIIERFQRLTKKWNYFNGLKRKFQWISANSSR
jgi:hypothetical protein